MKISGCIAGRNNPHIHLTVGGPYPGSPRYRHLAIGLSLDGSRVFLNQTPLALLAWARRGNDHVTIYWQMGPLWLTTSEG